MTETVLADRTAATDHPVLDVLADRWSPRAFAPGAAVDEAALSAALEAARWAPSAFNAQPWRFVVANAGSRAFERVLASLTEFNQAWAAHAGALVVAIAVVRDDDGRAVHSALYDLGQAVAHFSVQAHAEGLHVHQMTGFDVDALRAAFDLPDQLLPFTVTAVGTLGDPAQLSDALRSREQAPRVRRPLAESVLVRD